MRGPSSWTRDDGPRTRVPRDRRWDRRRGRQRPGHSPGLRITAWACASQPGEELPVEGPVPGDLRVEARGHHVPGTHGDGKDGSDRAVVGTG